MDIGSIATVLVASHAAQAQLAVAAKMMRMNADAEKSVVQLLQSAQSSAGMMADAATGLGQSLDITI